MPQLGSSQLGSTTTGADDAVQAVVDLLSGSSNWTLTAPDVYRHEELSQQEKESNPDPAVYCWSPVDAQLNPFAAEYDHIDERRFVESQVWGLDQSDTEQYHQDIITILGAYANDNEQQTNFHWFRPRSATDSRSDKIAQMTDHYIMSVQTEVHNHRDL